MDSQLTKILAVTRRGVEERKATSSRRVLEQAANAHQPRGFAHALQQKALHGPAVIAELKKASPSRGLIRPDFDVASLAAAVAGGGAAALSVLTEEHFFQGSLRNLEVASQSCYLPCLRKDFVVDEFQLLEARAHRADAILLIVRILTDEQLKSFHTLAVEAGLAALVEVHDEAELERALAVDAALIGINNRNLDNFTVDLGTTARLSAKIRNSLIVAESGLHTRADVEQVHRAGASAILVGESLLRSPDGIAAKIRALIP